MSNHSATHEALRQGTSRFETCDKPDGYGHVEHHEPKVRIVNGLRYSTAESVMVSSNESRAFFYRFVFRTPGGRYFVIGKRSPSPYPHHTGEIEPISVEQAVRWYDQQSYGGQQVSFAEAFPDYEVVGA